MVIYNLYWVLIICSLANTFSPVVLNTSVVLERVFIDTMSTNSAVHCHNVQISGSINQPSVSSHAMILEEQAPMDLVTVVDSKQNSDKVPLTDLHLCRYENCHSAKKGGVESPLDPVKTKAMYILLLLAAGWAVFYIIFTHIDLI